MMRKVVHGYTLFNILSLDVALGAIVSALFFARVFDVHLRMNSLIALGLTVWMIYTVDHLLDARKLKRNASTERHRFHQRHFKVLVVILILAGLVVTSQLFFIRTPVLIGGLVLSWIIVIYFLTLKKLKYLKELAGAILYTGGVLVAPLSLYHNSLLVPQVILICQFFITALINLLIFSWFDMEKDIQDRRESFATYYGVDLTYKAFMFLVLINTLVGIYIVLQNDRYLWMEICLLVMNSVLAALVFEKKYFNIYDRYRVLGDAIFFIPLVYILL
jgi:hypothetical protein